MRSSEEQQAQLDQPRRNYSLSARALFATLDGVYGRDRDPEKFRVIEVVARVPYQAWESVAYIAMTHTSKQPDFARRIYDRARVARFEQDNEQWHMLILEELTKDRRRAWLKGRIVPQVLAVIYYQLSWILFVLNPKWSYRLNADLRGSRRSRVRPPRGREPRVGNEKLRKSVRSGLRLLRQPGRHVFARSVTTKSSTARKANS